MNALSSERNGSADGGSGNSSTDPGSDPPGSGDARTDPGSDPPGSGDAGSEPASSDGDTGAFATHRRWMKRALQEAEAAFEDGEVPVGAVVVKDDRLVGKDRNRVEALGDPTAHAEMLAITAACDTLDTKYLEGCTLYVTLEPCPMCAGALVWARVDRLVFGAFDEKAGSCSTLYNIPRDERLNHRVEIVSGVEEERSGELMSTFFSKRRKEEEDE